MKPTIRGFLLLMVVLCAVAFPAAVQAEGTPQFPEPESPQPTYPFYIGPRIGPSTVTGYLGVEAQYDHLALDGGLLFDNGMNLPHPPQRRTVDAGNKNGAAGRLPRPRELPSART